MHPTKFDRGAVLAREVVDVPRNATVGGMVERLGEVGANMLVEGIERGLFVEPKGIVDVDDVGELTHAPKITTQDRKIGDWRTISAHEILRRDRVLGRLWDDEMYGLCHSSGERKRVAFGGGWTVYAAEEAQVIHRIPWEVGKRGGVVIFRIPGVKGIKFAVEMRDDGALMAPNEATIEGEKKGMGVKVLTQIVKGRMGKEE